jgi:hypothetical protein
LNRQVPGLAGGTKLFSNRGHFVLFSVFAGGLATMEIKQKEKWGTSNNQHRTSNGQFSKRVSAPVIGCWLFLSELPFRRPVLNQTVDAGSLPL